MKSCLGTWAPFPAQVSPQVPTDPSNALPCVCISLSSPLPQNPKHSRTPRNNTKNQTQIHHNVDRIWCSHLQEHTEKPQNMYRTTLNFPRPTEVTEASFSCHCLDWNFLARSSCPWKLSPAQTCAGCFKAFLKLLLFFLIFMRNYPKRLENGNIDILIQHSLTSILQPIQCIGIQDALFESLLNFPLRDWAHSLPLLLSVRLRFLSGVVLGTTLGNKITLLAHRALFLHFQLRFQIITGCSFITKVFCGLFHNSTSPVFDIPMDAQVGLFKGVKEHRESSKMHIMMLLFFQFGEKTAIWTCWVQPERLKLWFKICFHQGMV